MTTERATTDRVPDDHTSDERGPDERASDEHTSDDRASDVVPFGWGDEEVRPPDTPDTMFRFPTARDPVPGTRRVLAMALYAAVLGIGGVGVGFRGMSAVLGGGVPGWYVPVLAFGGLASVALAVAAFLAIHRPRLPWMLLIAASVPLAVTVTLATVY